MRILFYSSPYDYYFQNLEPVAKLAIEQGHEVFWASSEQHTEDIKKAKIKYHHGEKDFINKFLDKKLKVHCVILTQPWWYIDRKIAERCNKLNIPFYIIDHAPPMIAYTEKENRLSHLYRKSLNGAKAFFAYGQKTKEIMELRGCTEKIVPIGSPRINDLESRSKQYKNESKIAVIYDTSNRMEDQSMVTEFLKIKKSLSNDWQFLIRQHSRSPGFFNELTKQHDNIKISDKKEEELAGIASLGIFTFPSSAMILLAKKNVPMLALYHNHFCSEAREYAQLYRKIISLSPDFNIKNSDYSRFLRENLFDYENNHQSAHKILKFIVKDLK